MKGPILTSDGGGTVCMDIAYYSNLVNLMVLEKYDELKTYLNDKVEKRMMFDYWKSIGRIPWDAPYGFSGRHGTFDYDPDTFEIKNMKLKDGPKK